MSALSFLSIVLALFLSLLAYARSFRRHPARPPGPKPLPFIGNALDIPKTKGYIVFKEWEKQYNSKLLYVSALGQHVLIINSLEDANQFLEERAPVTSDRPWLPLLDLMGATTNTLLMRYGDSWRFHRRVLHQNLRKGVLEHYRPILTRKSHILLHRLAQNPTEFLRHFKMYSSSLIMDVVYGYDLESPNDEFFEWAEKVISEISENVQASKTSLVNILPVLRHYPSWLPGGSFQTHAAGIKMRLQELRDHPFNLAKEASKLDELEERLDVVSQVLKNKEERLELTEELLRDVALSAFVAGVETTASALGSFVLALCLCPDVQDKAQEEIFRVVGAKRLPTLEDRPSMPYLEAVYRETLRWKPPAPQALPHSTLQDEVLKGYVIPAGTIVVPNVWAMMQDEELYPEPEAFRPERFLKPDGTLNIRDGDKVVAYGFGRRVCPGKHLASESFWLAMAHILATFHIMKARDRQGREIPLTLEYIDDEAVTRPAPFECSITASRELDNLT